MLLHARVAVFGAWFPIRLILARRARRARGGGGGVRTDSSSRPVFDQTALRERRRKHMPIILGGDFDLSVEVAAICAPLAGRVAALPSSPCAGRWVDDVVGSVHEIVGTIVGWLAEVDARAKTRHLDAAKRGHAIRLLSDLTQRPVLPQIDDEMLATGSWVGCVDRDGRAGGRAAGWVVGPQPPAQRGNPARYAQPFRAVGEAAARNPGPGRAGIGLLPATPGALPSPPAGGSDRGGPRRAGHAGHRGPVSKLTRCERCGKRLRNPRGSAADSWGSGW